jgi:hypothetical protein
VFHQLSRIGLFATKRAFVHLEDSDLQEDFFPKLTLFSQGNYLIDAAASHIAGFLRRDT